MVNLQNLLREVFVEKIPQSLGIFAGYAMRGMVQAFEQSGVVSPKTKDAFVQKMREIFDLDRTEDKIRDNYSAIGELQKGYENIPLLMQEICDDRIKTLEESIPDFPKVIASEIVRQLANLEAVRTADKAVFDENARLKTEIEALRRSMTESPQPITTSAPNTSPTTTSRPLYTDEQIHAMCRDAETKHGVKYTIANRNFVLKNIQRDLRMPDQIDRYYLVAVTSNRLEDKATEAGKSFPSNTKEEREYIRNLAKTIIDGKQEFDQALQNWLKGSIIILDQDDIEVIAKEVGFTPDAVGQDFYQEQIQNWTNLVMSKHGQEQTTYLEKAKINLRASVDNFKATNQNPQNMKGSD